MAAAKKRAYDVVDAPSANAPVLFFDYLAPELRAHIATYLSPKCLPMLVALNIVSIASYENTNTVKRRIAYDTQLLEWMGWWCTQLFPNLRSLLTYYATNTTFELSDELRRALCALIVRACPKYCEMYIVGISNELIKYNHWRMLGMLVSAFIEECGSTSLYWNNVLFNAIQDEAEECVDILLKAGVNPNGIPTSRLSNGMLVDAIGVANPSIVRMLLAAGANAITSINAHKSRICTIHMLTGPTVAGGSMRSGRWNELMEILDLLLKHGADINCTGGSQYPPLFCAIRDGNTLMVRELLDRGASIQRRTNMTKWASPLHVSIEKDTFEISKLLIARGADITACGVNGESMEAYLKKVWRALKKPISAETRQHFAFLRARLALARHGL